MDTRFWGPSAWVMLHSLVFLYTPKKREIYKIFFENLKNVLPCIYCRVSFTEYIEKIPIDTYLDSQPNLCKWLYLVHNLVNNKLRSQGLLHYDDPDFDEIYNRYKIISKRKCKSREESILGWNFLYSIAFNYGENGINNVQQSHYNGYFQFFSQLGYLLPKKMAQKYNDYISRNSILHALSDRKTLVDWLYNLELEMGLNECPTLEDISEYVESYRAGCGGMKKDLKPTCRKIK